jgi:oligopeptide transport system substrate-binding protein
VLGSGEQPARSLVPAGTANYTTPARYPWAGWSLDRRQARARELLAAAGYPPARPLRLELRYRASQNDERVAVAAQSMWKAVGVELKLLSTETAVHYARLQSGAFDLGLASWLAIYSDPQTFTLLLQSATGANNFGAYRDDEYDRLTRAAAAATDLDQRAALLRRAEARALKEHGLIPVYHHASRNLVAARVTGWRDNLLDVHRSRYLGLESR